MEVISSEPDEPSVHVAHRGPSREDADTAAQGLIDEMIDDVILSNNRQPSIAGVVLEVITDLIMNPVRPCLVITYNCMWHFVWLELYVAIVVI